MALMRIADLVIFFWQGRLRIHRRYALSVVIYGRVTWMRQVFAAGGHLIILCVDSLQVQQVPKKKEKANEGGAGGAKERAYKFSVMAVRVVTLYPKGSPSASMTCNIETGSCRCAFAAVQSSRTKNISGTFLQLSPFELDVQCYL